jgi:hypothetical protein
MNCGIAEYIIYKKKRRNSTIARFVVVLLFSYNETRKYE